MAKSRFSIKSNLNEQSKSQAQKTAEAYDLRPIPLNMIDPNPDNFYGMRDIEILAASISISGLHNPPLLWPADENGRYKIIDGERRYRACKLNLENGDEKYSVIMCQISRADSEAMMQYQMVSANATARVITPAEKVEEAALLKKLYEQLRDEGSIEGGRIRQYVMEWLGISNGQAAIMENVHNNLSPELKEAFSSGDMGITAANVIASMPKEQQAEVAEAYKTNGAEAIRAAAKRAKKPKAGAVAAEEQTTAHHGQDAHTAMTSAKEKTTQAVAAVKAAKTTDSLPAMLREAAEDLESYGRCDRHDVVKLMRDAAAALEKG